MLELVNLGRQISRDAYDQTFPAMGTQLSSLQRAARSARVPVIVLFEGWCAAGKGTVINDLAQALDPRGFKVHPIMPANEVEQFYPWMQRFWNATPADGRFAIFDRSWYGRVLAERVEPAFARGVLAAGFRGDSTV